MNLDGLTQNLQEGLSFKDVTTSSFFNNGITESFSPLRAAFWGLGTEVVYDVVKWAEQDQAATELPNGLVTPAEALKTSLLTNIETAVNESRITPAYCKNILKKMYEGSTENGGKELSLKTISDWKVNDEFVTQNIKQHSGFSAEVISTAKENIQAQREGTGIKTYRADDLPDKFPKNDQYVDKVRINEAGEIVERIQSKFVGDSGESCLKKLTSKKMDKYFVDGKVDTLEIPKDFYKEIKDNNLIDTEINKLKEQLERVTKDGKTEVAEKIENKISRLKQIDEMVKPSSVTSEEAIYATKHPKRYTAKITAEEAIKNGNADGLKSGVAAAGITFCMSSVDNIRKVMNDEVSAKDAFKDVAKETGTAGAVGYGSAFVSRAAETAMCESSHELINSLGNVGVTAAVVSFAVESYDSVTDFATGTIDAAELAVDLGENAVGVAGSMAGSAAAGAAAGAALGSVVPGAGTVVGAAVGFAASMVGGMVGYALTTEAYNTAVEFGSDTADGLLKKAEGIAKETIETAEQQSPEAGNTVREAISKFNILNKIPINVDKENRI